jgi:hypothetical protein
MKIRFGLMTLMLFAALNSQIFASPDGPNQNFSDRDQSRGVDKAGFGRTSIGVGNEWGDPDSAELSERLAGMSDAELDKAMDLILDLDVPLEDAILMILMGIAGTIDKEIEAQADKIAEIQSGKGPETGGEKPSVDVETTKLKQLTERRGQLFDTVRQVVDKYEETAKGSIQGLSR